MFLLYELIKVTGLVRITENKVIPITQIGTLWMDFAEWYWSLETELGFNSCGFKFIHDNSREKNQKTNMGKHDPQWFQS